MKGLNKLALATAIAAVPFASQAMEPMSDQDMGNTTGQAGVTIELDTNLAIDQIAYSQGDGTGSFLLNNTTIGGVDDTSLDLAINIDLVEDGTAAGFPIDPTDPSAGTTRTLQDGDALISLKNIENDSSEMVDMNVSIDEMGLAPDGESDFADGATMISGLDMDMYLSKLDIIAQVKDLGGQPEDTGNSGSLGIDVAFAIDNLDVSFDVAAVELVGMRMAGAGTLDTLSSDGAVDGVTDAGGGQYVPDVTPAVVSMDIGVGGAVAADIDEALNINLANFQADIWMPEINVGSGTGAGSIGSVGISNLQVTDTTMAIYGRD